jgi:N-acetyl-anhydromuramyl-L-alanine amidase AmpD
MRNITLIVIHCSAVKPGQRSSAEDIDRWHRARGWKNGIGYHYVVRRNGDVELGRSLDEVGAHCKGHNSHSIGICYEGGLDEQGKPADTRTAEQKLALRLLLEKLHDQYPVAVIVGHHDLNPKKACPCFDVVRDYIDLEPRPRVIRGLLNFTNEGY